MHRVALAALALLLVLPPAQALTIDGPEDVVDLANRALEAALESSPVPVPTVPLDLGLGCVTYRGYEASIGYGGTVCAEPADNVPALFEGDGPAETNDTVPAAAQPPNETVAEEPSAPEVTVSEASMESEPAPQSEPAPSLHAPGPALQPTADLAPAPAPSTGGGLSARLLALTAAAAAAAVVPTLALKLASLLALRRARRKDSPVRAEILALLAAEPGLHHTELVRRIGRGNGTVEHHVHALVREGLLTRLRTPGYTCYFPAERVDRAARARVAVRSSTSRAILSALAQAPGPRSLSELAADLDVALSTAHYHAGRLAAAGVLADERLGARRGLALTPLGRSLAESSGASAAASGTGSEAGSAGRALS